MWYVEGLKIDNLFLVGNVLRMKKYIYCIFFCWGNMYLE